MSNFESIKNIERFDPKNEDYQPYNSNPQLVKPLSKTAKQPITIKEARSIDEEDQVNIFSGLKDIESDISLGFGSEENEEENLKVNQEDVHVSLNKINDRHEKQQKQSLMVKVSSVNGGTSRNLSKVLKNSEFGDSMFEEIKKMEKSVVEEYDF